MKAFRARLADESFRRVEGYITIDEKTAVDQIRCDLGVTADVAIAGLVRLGLSTYQSARSPEPTPSVGARAADAGYSPLAQSPAVQGAANPQVMSFAASVASPSVSERAPLSSTPIAQFFKSRKETNNAK